MSQSTAALEDIHTLRKYFSCYGARSELCCAIKLPFSRNIDEMQGYNTVTKLFIFEPQVCSM